MKKRVLGRVGLRVPLLAFAITAVGFTAQASAATLGQVGGNVGCAGGYAFAEASGDYVVPASGGTVTSFSTQVDPGDDGQKIDFLILSPTGPPTYTVVGSTGAQTLAGSGIETFPASIPVAPGDVLGEWENGLDNCGRADASATNLYDFTSDPPVSTSLSLAGSESNDLNLAANLVPSCSTTVTGSVPGSLSVPAGAAVCINQASVGGAVIVKPGGALSVADSHISGAIDSSGADSVTVCGSTVGAIDIKGSSQLVQIGDVSPGCGSDDVLGALSVTDGLGGAEILGNSVSGTLTLSGNDGSLPPTLESNSIGGSLECTSNNPLPVDNGEPNTVRGANSGECATL